MALKIFILLVGLFYAYVIFAQENITMADNFSLPKLKFKNENVYHYLKKSIKKYNIKEKECPLFLSAYGLYMVGEKIKLDFYLSSNGCTQDKCKGFFYLDNICVIVENEYMDEIGMFSKEPQKEEKIFNNYLMINKGGQESMTIRYLVTVTPKRIKIKEEKQPRMPKYQY